jgi:SAM-dependent methyltransferase
METIHSLAPGNFWQQQHGHSPLEEAGADHPVIRWLSDHIPLGKGDCIEIGCFQGHFLPFFGRLGYRLHGIDVIPRVHEMPAWLKAHGFVVGDFWQQDFFSFQPPRKYDIVCSFGFFEHFIEWETVVARHLEWVAPEGLLVIMCPNFAGAWQKHFHRLFDKQNLLHHHLPAMDPCQWRALVEKAGLTTLFCGHFGRFDFRVAYQQRSFFAKLMVHGMVDIFVPLLRRLPWPEGKKLYAPCCGLIAKKGEPQPEKSLDLNALSRSSPPGI